MNIKFLDILNSLADAPFVSQRELAQRSGHALGTVNSGLRALCEEGYLDQDMALTDKARQLLADRAPKNAVILAAGAGMRMAPINIVTPKGLLEVHGETLIERLIRQLHEVGVTDITVVVGFMMESYEFLIDQYGVELVINRDYALKNNLHSLALAIDRVSNTYILPCDVWCEENPFSSNELYSWYMVTDAPADNSNVQVNRKSELTLLPSGTGGNAIIGISYLTEEQAAVVRERVRAMDEDSRNNGSYWEEALYEKDRLTVCARVISSDKAVEINTYEQLRELDNSSSQLHSEAIDTAAEVLGVTTGDILEIEALKKGLTNHSFIFTCQGKRYIMRVPGKGSMVDRRAEGHVYDVIIGKDLCDNILYFDPETGYKISEYMENTRTANVYDPSDVRRCMEKLRALHEMGLTQPNRFDLYQSIEEYEDSWGTHSVFRDHAATKEQALSLRPFIDAHPLPTVLCHLDANPDNFLFAKQPDGSEKLYLIDWEYAGMGMGDPFVDIALFCTFFDYTKEQCDRALDAYYPEGCSDEIRIRFYCILAIVNLWCSDWGECKRNAGDDLIEYCLLHYRLTKRFIRVAKQEIERLAEK